MKHYYPLDLLAKVKYKDQGYIPSKRFKKWKRQLLKNRLVVKTSFGVIIKPSLEDVLAKTYFNMNNFSDDGYTPDIIKCLLKIIPMEYFGTNVNRKRFFFVVERILTQNRGECIHYCVLFERFEYGEILWLNSKQDEKTQVLDANILVLQTVVKPFIRYYYHFLNTFRNRKFQIIPKGKVDSFLDSNISKAIKLKRMEKVKNGLRRSPLSGKLTFIPKRTISQLDHRPIVHNYLKNDMILQPIKNNLKSLIKLFQIGSESSLYEKWKTFVECNKGRKKLYAVKLDLLDAFGLVDLDQLKIIIQNDKQFLTAQHKDILLATLSKQFIHVRGKKEIYKWNHGLLQGTRLSPILCELYLSYITYNRLKVFNKSNCFMHRTVDDMFFVSTCESEVAEFELAAFGVSILNEEKTQRFLHPEDDPQIVFCGKIFNLETRETCAAYDFPRGKELRSKFKFWNRKIQYSKDEAYEFIVNSMKFAYVNFYFSRFELNTACNSVETVLKNIFDGMCFVGFKLFYAVDSIEYLFHSSNDRSKTVLRCVDFITSSYPPVIHKIIVSSRGEHYQNIFSYNLIKFLCWKALIVVLQRRHFKYKEVIASLKRRTKEMWVPKLTDNIKIKFMSKLPKTFENIVMRRTAGLDN